MAYIELKTIQNELKKQYNKKNKCFTVPQIIQILCQNPSHIISDFVRPFPEKAWSLSDTEFYECFDHAAFPIHDFKTLHLEKNWRDQQYSVLNTNKFIRVYKHLNFSDQQNHTHNRFEITYVMKGSCSMTFEKKSSELKLTSGDVCIIAPNSVHRIILLDEDAFVLNIIISKKAFEAMLMQIMLDGDLISKYLQAILYQEDRPNYLFIHTSNSDEIKFYIKSATCEAHYDKYYSYSKAISWITLFLGTIFREFRHSIHIYQNENSAIQENHLLLIQYLQKNYHNVTLDAVAKLFNYNKTYLSRLIIKLTGKSFIEIITEFKLAEACDYLEKTNLKIHDIAEMCGFDNQNYFCKVFKKYYHVAPTDYRQRKVPD